MLSHCNYSLEYVLSADYIYKWVPIYNLIISRINFSLSGTVWYDNVTIRTGRESPLVIFFDKEGEEAVSVRAF